MKVQHIIQPQQSNTIPQSPTSPSKQKQIEWKKYFHEDFKFEIKPVTNYNNKRPVLVLDLNRVMLSYDNSENIPQQKLIKIFAAQSWKRYLTGKISMKTAYKKIQEQIIMPIQQIQDALNTAREALKPIPRCINLIRQSKNLGLILVAFTNCPQEEILALIKRFDFLSDFDLILNSGNLGYRKPNKQAYLALCNYLNVQPSRIVYLDDQKQNVQMGKSIGYHAFHCKKQESYSEVQSYLRGLYFQQNISREQINFNSPYSSNLNRAYYYLTALADLDKYGFYQSICGVGDDIIKSPKKSNEIFCTVTVLTICNSICLSENGSKMIRTLEKMHLNNKYKFFSDLEIIPQDTDTSSITLTLLYKYNLISDEAVGKVLEQMKQYVDDKVFLTFFTHKRYRKCPIVGTNVMFLIHLVGKQKQFIPYIEKTKAFVMSQLVTKNYCKGVTFYPNPDLYLFQIAKLVYNFPLDFQQFKVPLYQALKERLQSPAQNTMSLAIRCILSFLFDLDCTNDFEQMIDEQLSDGSWQQSFVFWTSSATPDKKCYWSSRAYNTGFCYFAIQMKIFGKEIFRICK